MKGIFILVNHEDHTCGADIRSNIVHLLRQFAVKGASLQCQIEIPVISCTQAAQTRPYLSFMVNK